VSSGVLSSRLEAGMKRRHVQPATLMVGYTCVSPGRLLCVNSVLTSGVMWFAGSLMLRSGGSILLL
jgi:hypothetical protein